MKNFYVTLRILYSYLDEETKERVNESECYEEIVSAKTEKSAIKKAKIQSAKSFDQELLDKSMFDVTIVIDDCYETSDDARL